jgi:hypothetical protein
LALQISTFPSSPQCDGTQWVVTDIDQLASLAALVLVGRAKHAANIINGSRRIPGVVPDSVKTIVQLQLDVTPGADPSHRDGLLFEIISWIAIQQTAGPNDLISDPHLKSTQQGIDTLRITFDSNARTLTRATICEQKCTINPRKKFKKEVLPSFEKYWNGERDPELVQSATGLLSRYSLTDEEQLELYDVLLQERPLSFRASLTVAPSPYLESKCVKLFKDFESIPVPFADRLGDTFPQMETRKWFNDFAKIVLSKIEAGDV